MRTVSIIVIVGLIALVYFEVYFLWQDEGERSQKLEVVNRDLKEAKLDQAKLEAELRYLLNPVNLEKELRARFNLRGKNEKLIIIVPAIGSSTSE